MHRCVRSVIALCAAYALVLAALIGALGSARATQPSGFQLCIAGDASGGTVPAQAEHDLCCILACGAGGQPALVGGSIAPIASPVRSNLFVSVIAPVHRQFERLSSAQPRGPPLRA